MNNSKHFQIRIRLLVALAGSMMLSCMLTDSVRAESWMFRRSYYSHQIPAGQQKNYPRPQSRSAYRRPYLHQRPGFAIRGAYRYNIMRLRSGSSTDTTVFRENWFDVQP